MNDRCYIRAYRNEFADPDAGAPFTVSMADGSVYASRDLTAGHLHALRRDINEALGEGMVEMTDGDINGNPEDWIDF